MLEFLMKMLLVTVCLPAILFLAACQEPPPQKKAVSNPVVSGHIPKQVVQKKVPRDHGDKGKLEEPGSKESKIAAHRKISQLPKTAAKPLNNKNAGPSVHTVLPSSSMEKSKELAGELLFTKIERYDATDRIDPFAPLISTEKKSVKAVASQPSEEDLRIRTPLEKLDWSQMRLVAVVQAESGNLAMVEEVGGKGYIVKLGTYMGKNSGRVVSIHKDRIVISEKVKDYKGEIVVREHEIRLNKPDNED